VTRENRSGDEAVRDAYDRVPYPSGSIHHSQPDNLAVRALLFGLEPPDLARVRVLELGCADGGNLIPMASELPEGRFLGIDLSPRQIEEGRRHLANLGIGNVDLRAMSILDVDAGLGEFDYIVVHGVFSWVGPEVREKILAICRTHLAPRGVAYVSYNAYPGWHQREMLREMMLYRTRGEADPYRATEQAVGLLDFLAEAVPADDAPHSLFLKGRREHLAQFRGKPSYLIHEYLERSNTPFYFHQFMAMAARHGLQYLADAEIEPAEIESLPPAVAARLRALSGDRLELEQNLDFLRNRTFRRTLLCHQGLPLDLAMVPERIHRLHAASPVKPAAPAPDVRGGTAETFHAERDRTFVVSHPPTKALLTALAATWPRPVSFAALQAEVRERLGAEPDATMLADILFSLYCGDFLDLHLLPPACTEKVSERPAASPLARREAAAGPLVTNLRRRVLRLEDDMVRVLLLHLDGTHDHEALRGVLDREVREGRLGIERDGEPVRDAAHRAEILGTLVERSLQKMAELALLVR